jgi:membrane protein
MMKAVAIYQMVKRAILQWNEDGASRYSASIAFFTIFSIAPLMTIVIIILGVVYGENAARGAIVDQIEQLTGRAGAEAIQTVIANARFETGGGLATIIASVVLVIGATRVFTELQEALNAIWNVVAEPRNAVLGFIWKRTVSFGMILVIGMLLLLSLVMSAILAVLHGQISRLLDGSLLAIFIRVGDLVVSLGIITLLFGLMYKFVPDAKIRWRDVWVGAFITAMFVTIGKFLIGLYLGRSDTASTFGAAGSFLIFLIWIYYSLMVFFLGAEFTQAYSERFGSGIVPASHARYLDESKVVGSANGNTEPPTDGTEKTAQSS